MGLPLFHGVPQLCIPKWNYLSEGTTISSILKWISGEHGKASVASIEESKQRRLCWSKAFKGFSNTPHSITGQTPAEILLGRTPRTRLSLVHPCMAQWMSIVTEEWVGNQSPRTFSDGQAVYLCDLHPNRWVSANIVRKLGLLAYEMNTNGHLRQAHIDHLKPQPEPQPSTDAQLDSDTPPSDGDEQPSASSPLAILDDDSTSSEQPDSVMNATPEPVVCLQWNRQPPCRLIEEIS